MDSRRGLEKLNQTTYFRAETGRNERVTPKDKLMPYSVVPVPLPVSTLQVPAPVLGNFTVIFGKGTHRNRGVGASAGASWTMHFRCRFYFVLRYRCSSRFWGAGAISTLGADIGLSFNLSVPLPLPVRLKRHFRCWNQHSTWDADNVNGNGIGTGTTMCGFTKRMKKSVHESFKNLWVPSVGKKYATLKMFFFFTIFHYTLRWENYFLSISTFIVPLACTRKTLILFSSSFRKELKKRVSVSF